MNCPVDASVLQRAQQYGMELDQCPECQGMWLDYVELDQLEDRGFKMDLDKGSLVFSPHEGIYLCPKCGSTMKRFEYRLHGLQLDLCPELHGFWLDRGEDKRVLDLMKEREKDIKRKVESEREWEKTLRQLRSPTFVEKVRHLFK